MKPRLLVLALLAALGSGCSSMDKPSMAPRVEPVLSIHHGGAPDAQSYYQLGRYYHGQSRLAQAEEAYSKAIATDDRHVDAYNALASLYAERGELERAVQMFQRATAMAPDRAYLYNNLGYAYYLQGRQDEAYGAVRKALSLDATLVRGWANLERIAGMRSEGGLLDAAKARRLDALPTELASTAIPDGSGVEPAPTAIEPAPAAASTLAVAVEQPVQITTPSVKLEHEAGASSVTLEPSLAQSGEDRIAGGKFTLVSSSREVVSNDGAPIEITRAVPAAPSATRDRQMSIPAFQLEVTNGNGVARFANSFSSRLRGDNIPVARITNLSSYSLQKTVIEYQPGYEAAARALMDRTRLEARLVPALKLRPRSDVRIMLGKDALQLG